MLRFFLVIVVLNQPIPMRQCNVPEINTYMMCLFGQNLMQSSGNCGGWLFMFYSTVRSKAHTIPHIKTEAAAVVAAEPLQTNSEFGLWHDHRMQRTARARCTDPFTSHFWQVKLRFNKLYYCWARNEPAISTPSCLNVTQRWFLIVVLFMRNCCFVEALFGDK